MKVLESQFVKDFIRLTEDGNGKGWHERNGGNLSYRIRPEEVESVKLEFTNEHPFAPIGTSVPALAGEYFLVTGSKRFMRNVVLDPEDNLAIIELDGAGENYRIRWGLRTGGVPTSELPAHLMNHEVKKIKTGGVHRVIYHAHTPNIIALTFVLPLDDKVFTRELWEMMTECPMIFPDGVGVVPWMVPGGRDIAVRTSELMKKYDVAIWAHHGTFCSADTLDQAFGLMDTVEKAGEVLVKVLSMSPVKRQTITGENFKSLADAFELPVNREFLD